MNRINDFTEGKILSPLIRFAIPILLSQLLQTAYGAVDMLVIGTFGSTADVSADYLKAYAIDCLLTSFPFCFNGYFNGLGRTRFVMAQSIAGAFGVRIPVSYLMSRQVPVSLFHVGLATPCSTFIQIVLCFIYFFLLRRKNKSENTKVVL